MSEPAVDDGYDLRFELTDELAALASSIELHRTCLDTALARRFVVFQQLRALDPPMTCAAIGAAAGVTGEAVEAAFRRARAKK